MEFTCIFLIHIPLSNEEQNENMNGWFREYFPKNKEMDTGTDSCIEQAILKLNL